MFSRPLMLAFALFSLLSFANHLAADLTEIDCFEVPDNAILGDMNPNSMPPGQGSITTDDGQVWTATVTPATGTDYTDIIVNSQALQTGTTNVLDNVRGATRNLESEDLGTAYGNPGTGDFDTNDATLCFWISPDLNGGDQVIFESGGATDGNGLILIGDGTNQFDLSFGVKDGPVSATTTVDLLALYDMTTPDFTDFLKITAFINLTEDQITLDVENLGTGLSSSSSAAYTGTDWDGTDNAGLFQVGGGAMGAAAPLEALRNGGSWQNFDGQFAGMKVYAGVPEPGSCLLLAFAATGLAFRRRRN